MIEIMYTCRECGLEKRKVKVVPRGAKENIIAFTDRAMRSAGRDHAIMAPVCRPKTLDLYIPFPKTSRKGG